MTRCKGLGEFGLGPPPGAVARCNQAGFNARLQVANRGIDTGFHRLTGQMKAPENDIDGCVRKINLRSQAHIDNAGVRTGGKYGHAPLAHAGGDEALVHDQGIGLTVVAVEAVVPGKTGLLLGNSLDCAAGKKETFAQRTGFIALDDLAACLRDLGESRLVGKHGHHPARKKDAALVRPLRMQID